jgi:hypothetical protein
VAALIAEQRHHHEQVEARQRQQGAQEQALSWPISPSMLSHCWLKMIR